MNINAIRMSTLILGIPLPRQELRGALNLLYEGDKSPAKLEEFIAGIEKSLDETGLGYGKYKEMPEKDNIFVMRLDDGDVGLKVGTSCDTNEDHDEMRLARLLGVKRGISLIRLGVEIDMDLYEYHIDMDELLDCLRPVARIVKTGEEVAEEVLYDKSEKCRPDPVILSVYDHFFLTLDFDLFSGRIISHLREDYGEEAAWRREGSTLILPREIPADSGSVFLLNLRALQGAGDNVEDVRKSLFAAYGMPLRGEKREQMISKANEIYLSLMSLV